MRKINRTLLEMQIGLLFWGLVCRIAGVFLAENQGYFAKSLWFGILFAMISTVHMYRQLDRALDYGERTANKMIFGGYLIRYVFFVIIMIIIMITKVMNPLIVFLAYMGMKVTAFLQPITHKLCNMMFRETDPIPEALAEESTVGEEIPQE